MPQCLIANFGLIVIWLGIPKTASFLGMDSERYQMLPLHQIALLLTVFVHHEIAQVLDAKNSTATDSFNNNVLSRSVYHGGYSFGEVTWIERG